MARHPYDRVSLERLRARPGAKWKYFPEDVLPLWVAEMDFPLADAVKDAVRERLDADDLGYAMPDGLPGLREAVVERFAERFGVAFAPEQVALVGSTGTSLALASRAFAGPGDEVLLLTPLYPPFKRAVETAGRVPVEVELARGDDGYTIDFDALEATVTPATRMLMLCNPHNPVGRVFTQNEVEALASFALRHNLWVVSDDLHADLIFEGRHRPIAGVDDAIAQRTVTLYGPTKAFNVPGLKISFALSANPSMIDRMAKAGAGLTVGPNVAAQAATLGAYRHGHAWLDDTMAYLAGNRARVAEVVAGLPGVGHHPPQGTYLAWLDLRAAGLGEAPAKTLVERAKLGLNEGADFGLGGAGFVRLNFATTRSVLDDALERLATALA